MDILAGLKAALQFTTTTPFECIVFYFSVYPSLKRVIFILFEEKMNAFESNGCTCKAPGTSDKQL